MQDRFKFRIWHEPLKQMHYNDFIVTATGYTAKLYQEKDYMMKFNQEDLEFDKQCVVMQCTGLKDRKGKLIYEGDVVKINENYCDYSAIEDFYKNQNFIVEYFQPRAVYLLKPFEYKSNDGSGIYDLSPDFYEFLKWKPCGKLEEYTLQGIEVIGNIYQDKELLNEI